MDKLNKAISILETANAHIEQLLVEEQVAPITVTGFIIGYCALLFLMLIVPFYAAGKGIASLFKK